MCGISGIFSNSIAKEDRNNLLNTMLSSIVHRGPDNTGVWSDNRVSLGHQRLKIIDLSNAANQPFEYLGMQIVFNGEIYNYIELKNELVKEGYQFFTESDTEVVMAAYLHWGQKCVSKFVGMWAFALWNPKTNVLFCSRDRFGIKPFYYLKTKDTFAFASEYKALKTLPFFKNSINFEQLKRGLAFGWAVYEDESYYKDISVLKPSHNLILNADSSMEISRYWDIEADKKIHNKDYASDFLEMFSESIKIHSRSDVTIGGCLSGGLDSSAIASMFCKQFSNVPYKTFTIYYQGNGNVDERPFSSEVAKKYPQINPFTFSPNTDDISSNFHNVMHHADVPLMGASYISQYFLMRLAAQNEVVVLLDGQGADEYLGGYMHIFQRILGQDLSKFNFGAYAKMLNAHKNLHELSPADTAMLMLKSTYMAFNNENSVYLHEFNKHQKLFNQGNDSEIVHLNKFGDNKANEMLYHSLFRTSLPTLLHYEDRNSMAFSIESRVPFLDHRLLEYAFAMPFDQKVNEKSETKAILRKALTGILPDKITQRHDKKGFVTPGEVEWLRGPLSYLFDEIDYSNLEFLKVNEVKRLITEYQQGNLKNANLVWRLLSTSYWLKYFN